MFDTIIVESLEPLFRCKKFKELYHQYIEYTQDLNFLEHQSKSLECLLETFEITNEGYLRALQWSSSKNKYIKNDKVYKYTGQLNFYDYIHKYSGWIEFDSDWVNGKLIDIRLHSFRLEQTSESEQLGDVVIFKYVNSKKASDD